MADLMRAREDVSREAGWAALLFFSFSSPSLPGLFILFVVVFAILGHISRR